MLLRLTLPIFLLSGALLVIGAATGWYIHQHQQSDSQFLSKCVASIRAAEELVIRTREIRTRLNQFVVTDEEKYLRVVPEMYSQTLEWLENAEQLASNAKERELTQRIRNGYQQFYDQYEHILSGRRSDKLTPLEFKSQVGRLIDDYLTHGVLAPVHDYLDANQSLISQTIPANQIAADRVGVGLLLLGICGAFAGLLAGYAFSRHVSRSLVQLSVPIHDAAGKLNDVVGPVKFSLSGGNLAELNIALRKMADHVGEVVSQLQQSQREALRAEQLAAVGQLAAGMAHELRNPLTAIKLIVQAAARMGSSGKIQGEDLTVLYEQILRQERSIQSFLDFARPPKLELQKLELTGITQRCVQLIAAQAESLHIHIECQLQNRAVDVLGDPEQLRQLIINLLVNSLDAMPDGGTLSVELCEVSLAELLGLVSLSPSSLRQQFPNWCLLTITDTGVGLPKDLGDRIFEPFVSSKETGLGLGLSICKRIAERHQGQIVARNGSRGGAQFMAFIPLAGANQNATEMSHSR